MKQLMALLVALVLFAAACGSDDDAGSSTTPSSTTSTVASTTTTSEAPTTTVAPTTTSAAPTTTANLEEMGIVPGLDPDVDAVVLAYEIAFSSDTTYEEKAPYIEEPEGLEATVEMYMTTGTVMGGVVVVVRDVVIDGEVAEVGYDLMLNGAPTYPDLIGDAVLTPDGWKLSRAMFCGLMALARAACPEV